jgi:hypothetical protein
MRGALTEVFTITSSASNCDLKSFSETTLSRPLITHLNVLYSADKPFRARITMSSSAKYTPAVER